MRLVLLLLLAPTALHAQWKTPWDYDGPRGPTHWAALDSAYAACNGHQQSPIDIRTTTTQADLKPLRFEYHSQPLKGLTDNGKTIRVNYHDSLNSLIIGSSRYHLTQFHFHHPAEDLVDGKQHDMVLHLMHASTDGKQVGVAVLITTGKPNPTVQRLFDHMPKTTGTEDAIPGIDLDPQTLLPKSLAYYMYAGSITAPPCTEGVTWYVLKTPITLSASQIAVFAKRYPNDVRPVQPLNGRVVKSTP